MCPKRLFGRRSVERPASIAEWLVVTALLLFLCAYLSYGGVLRRMDMAFFDTVTPWLRQSSADNIVVVAIDDATMRSLDGWPVGPSEYATLIDRLTQSNVAAIAFDVSVVPQWPEHDEEAALANAMRRSGKVVMLAESGAQEPPLDSALANAAFALGQESAYADVDGITRGVRLVDSSGRAQLEHMSVLVLRASGKKFDGCEENGGATRLGADSTCRRYVPIGEAPHPSVSALDVINGSVSVAQLQGRLILIGVTAIGVGARLAAPNKRAHALTNVEFLAEATDALESGSLISPAQFALQLACSLAATMLLCASLLLLGPLASLIASASVAFGVTLVAFLLLRQAHVFVFPSPAVALCIVGYPLWSWRRLEAVLRHVGRETRAMLNEPVLAEDPSLRTLSPDPVLRRLDVLRSMTARRRRFSTFQSSWVNSLPEATLVASPAGIVMLANERAMELASSVGDGAVSAPLSGRAVADVLFTITSSHKATAFAQQATERLTTGKHGIDLKRNADAAFTDGIELMDGKARSLLIKCVAMAPFHERDGALVFHIADVTSMRRAERQRDVTFRFISHDLRSRQAAILALVEQMRLCPPGLTHEAFRDRVAEYGTSALTLVDDFLFLARAESQAAQLVSVDLAFLLADAIDDVWSQAYSRNVTVSLSAEPERRVLGDMQLLRRAFQNLLSNAIKYGHDNAMVRVELGEDEQGWTVSVVDCGIGIPTDRHQDIFEEFARVNDDPRREGYGLGLAFVKSLVEGAGGKVAVSSTVNVGATFAVTLPKYFEN